MFQTVSNSKNSQSETMIQPSLEIGREDDEYEKEANHVADKVMRMKDEDGEKIRCMTDENEDKLQLMVDSPFSVLKKTDDSGGSMKASENVEQGISRSKGKGQSMSPDLKNEMEMKIGADFSKVKMHTDENAVQMNKEVGAKAFTHGNDIYFNRGNYNPATETGKHLLAHELTHTVQQGAAVRKKSSGVLSSSTEGRINPMIQKADGDSAKTAYGEFVAERYHEITRSSDGEIVGFDLYLKFNPGENVDATLIGITQAAEGKVDGVQVRTGPQERSATSGNGVGYSIDVTHPDINPLYAVSNTVNEGKDNNELSSYNPLPSEKLNSFMDSGYNGLTNKWGGSKFGYHYKKEDPSLFDPDKPKGDPFSSEFIEAPAEIEDNPMKPFGTMPDSIEQIFETTALAIEGNQKGQYYGSVKFGYKKDKGKFQLLNLEAASQSIPTANFLTAAKIFNESKTVDKWYEVKTPSGLLDNRGINPSGKSLKAGIKLEVDWTGKPPFSGDYTLVRVILSNGGAGPTGWLKTEDIASFEVNKETVDLPLADVFYTKDQVELTNADTKQVILPAGTRLKLLENKSDMFLRNSWMVEVIDGPFTGSKGTVVASAVNKEIPGSK